MQKRYSRERSLGYEAENYMDGVDNSYKRHAENLDENMDEDYTYKHGTAAAERRGTVSCEIIQRHLTSKLNSGDKYLHPYISVNFEIINEAVKCSNTTHTNNVICVC